MSTNIRATQVNLELEDIYARHFQPGAMTTGQQEAIMAALRDAMDTGVTVAAVECSRTLRRQPDHIADTSKMVSPFPAVEVRRMAIRMLMAMRPTVRQEALEDFLDSRGAWGKGGNAAYMHISPDEFLRAAALAIQSK